jgi:hypothetical protein
MLKQKPSLSSNDLNLKQNLKISYSLLKKFSCSREKRITQHCFHSYDFVHIKVKENLKNDPQIPSITLSIDI